MGHSQPRFRLPSWTPFLGQYGHECYFSDLNDLFDAQSIDIDRLVLLQGLNMDNTERDRRIDGEIILLSRSATVFLNFVLNGGGGHLDPGVAEVLDATRCALADAGVTWEELLEALREERWDVEATKEVV